MKLSLTIHNKTYSVETEGSCYDVNIDEVAEQFKGLLVGAGFHPSNVDEMFNTNYQWFTDEQRAEDLQGHIPQSTLDRLHNDKRVQDYQDNLYKNETPF
jgi:hypothetical protein